MRSVMIIGAIILAGCGSVTLADAPQDSGSEKRTEDVASSPRDAGNPSTDVFGAAVDDSGPDSMEVSHVEKDASPPPDLGSDIIPSADALPAQTCNQGTCYPKSDPQHTTCPCHY